MKKNTSLKSMRKNDHIDVVSKKTGLKKAEATQAVETILNSVIEAVARGTDVRLVGFGTFTVAERIARQGRNPRTGAALKIPAMKIPRFRPGKVFKEAVS